MLMATSFQISTFLDLKATIVIQCWTVESLVWTVEASPCFQLRQTGL